MFVYYPIEQYTDRDYQRVTYGSDPAHGEA